MNETAKRPAVIHTPPPDEIKTPALGDSGRTSQTKSLSDTMSTINDGDSVVSEITLDAAFDGKPKKSSDPSFHRNLVVARKRKDGSSNTTKRRNSLLPQETVSKLDGNDFLDGKFQSAFQKEMSTVQQLTDETEDEGISKKQEVMQQRLATEFANRKRELSNAKLDDLKENSLMDLFTSMNLAVDATDSSNVHKTNNGHRRRRSDETRENQERRHSREITFDPNLTTHIGDDDSADIPDDVKKEKHRQERRRSSEIRKRRQAQSANELDIRFDPNEREDVRRGRRSKSPRRGRDTKAREESQDIVFDPTESMNTSGFVPPPQISQLQEQEGLPEDSMLTLNASGFTTQSRRRSKSSRRHSASAKNKSSLSVKRQPPKDIPESIILGDEDSVNGLSLIGIEAEIRGDTKNDQRARRLSVSPPRRSHHRSEAPKTPRRRRHSSTHKSPKETKRKEDKGSPRRTRSDNERRHRSKSRRRSSHHCHYDVEDKNDRLEKLEEPKTSGHDSKSALAFGNTLDIDKEKEKKLEAPSDEHVEVLRKPINIRRTFSAPPIASPKKEPEPQDDDDDQDEAEAPSLATENVVFGLSSSASPMASTSTSTPKRGLWKRISTRSSITRPIASLGNERAAPRGSHHQRRSSWSQSPSSPSRRLSSSDGSRGGSSKRSMSSSSSSERSLRSSRGSSASDRSLSTSPVPITQQQPQTILPKARKNYTPTVVQDSTQILSYSERVMQGKIGILQPTPEGRTVEEFE